MRAAKERKRLSGPGREPWIADDRVESITYDGLGMRRKIVFKRIGKGRVMFRDGAITTATRFAETIRKWVAVKPRIMEE